ncbi:subtilisin-like protease SBT1.7 [Aegilops tauschii subsp. strangulata]|uniref:Subtilisin-like protease n=1 Tax=Aegilops tauschii subsp. strangulata TaxID=200361 RepID=A0A453KNV3_AEGTS|nr:subtilisin-like protease SBT1.7 [Aegilops tauschii subsp. strangulata]
MASMTSILLRCSLLLLLLVQSTHSSVTPKPKNAIAEEHKPAHPSTSSTYIVLTNHLAKPSKFDTLERWYASMVGKNSNRIQYTYGTVMHGFAARLTDGEAQRMATVPGVSRVYKDRLYHTQTTRSPWFMGLHDDFGAWPGAEFGDGIVIGFIDGGIWPERASFSDTGLSPVRSTWRGKCVDAPGFNASLCNNKLVGAKFFITADGLADSSPRDIEGHGTHVASTAAGSEVPSADLFKFAGGRASGVARRARIAMYKACIPRGCRSSDVTAAIDAAVSDGVDLISISLGSYAKPFHDDLLAVATFGAERRGVFVVLAGGNDGPAASTISNVAPWMTTVGAATTDRVFPATLRLGNGAVLTGQSLYNIPFSQGAGMIPLVRSDCGEYDLTPDRVMGKFVVCPEGTRAGAGFYVERAGGAGIVSAQSTDRFRDAVLADPFALPGLLLSSTGGKKLDDYMSSVAYPVASSTFTCVTVTGENRAPMVAGFSSRGPNPIVPEILKPDVIAPGVNILAAWSGAASPSHSEMDPRRVEYNILSGTSMACPHVAGVAALIKKRHGHWTPAMIRSALVTTAGPLDKDGRDIVDSGSAVGAALTGATPLAAGAGFVLPRLAMDPGLVYDAGTQDYVDFLCTLNYTVEQMRMFVPELTKCATTIPGGVANLNYPSFVVVFDGRTRVRTLTRTVTLVSARPERYNVTVAAPDGVKVTVTPATLEFRWPKEKRSYSVQFSSEAGAKVRPAGTWEFGHISWENRKHRVRSPVAFKWDN